MAELETPTEDETATSELLGEVKTNTTDVTEDATDVTEDATIESGDRISSKYKSTESEMNEDRRKERSWMDERQIREGESPWHIYMKS